MQKNFAKELPVGTIVALIGDLGSGKTTFAQGFAEGLDIFESIVSPTFKLVNEYDGEKCKLIHVDTYRLDGIEDFLNICGEDIIRTPGAIILIEWADKIIDILPPETVQINFQRVSNTENDRELIINALSE